MAFKQVGRKGNQDTSTTGDAIYAAKMPVGEVLEGYVVALPTKEENPDHANIVLKLAGSGENKMVFTAGNLAYSAGVDQNINKNVLTRITRLPDTKGVSKDGKKYTRSQFLIEQDEEQTLESAEFEAIFKEDQQQQQPAAEAPATTAPSVRDRAKALAKQVAEANSKR